MQQAQLNIREINDEIAFQGLHETWDKLLSESEFMTPFNTFEWAWAWWQAFGQGRKLSIVVINSNNRCIGIAPLCIKEGNFFSIIEFIGAGRSDYLDFISPLQYREEFTTNLFFYLKDNSDKWDILYLNSIFWQNNYLPILISNVRKYNLFLKERNYIISPYIPISTTWDDFLSDRGIKKKIRKKEKRLLGNGEIRIVKEDNYYCRELDGDIFSIAKQIEKTSWKFKKGNPRLQTDANSELFFQLMLKSFCENHWLSAWFCLIDGQPRAYAFSFAYNNKIYTYNSAYDDSFMKFGLGSLLHIFRLRDAFDEQKTEYDFLQGVNEHKKEWATHFRQIKEYTVFNSRLKSKILGSQYVRLRWILAKSTLIKKLRYQIICIKNKMRI